MSSRRARETRECRDGGERELAVMTTFTMVSDSGDLARSQQRERDSRRRRIAIWEKRGCGWRGNGSKEGLGRGVSGFILPRGRGLGWSFVGRDWASWAVVWGGVVV
jgi:hypothetical protein